MSLGFALAPFPQASAVAYGLGYAAALELTARRFPAALSSRAPGTRREKGFLIDRAEALRSTELGNQTGRVGWGHMPRYYRTGRSVAQSVVRGAALCPMERDHGSCAPESGSRMGCWAQREGCILDSPGPRQSPTAMGGGRQSVVQISGVPCVNNGLVWAGGQAGDRA